MAGAVGIVFGLCVLSFTLGAALMYVLVRRREDARGPSASDRPVERTWVEKPARVEPVDDDYDSRPIHRNPVVGLPQLEPALAALVEPETVEPKTAEPETVGAAGYDRDGDLAPPVGEVEAPESSVAASTDISETVEDLVEDVDEQQEPESEPDAEPEVPVEATLPPPAPPRPVEHTTWVEREDFRQRYLRTFEEVRRKAGSN
ncbi:hypothetical protein [Lentzea sp. NPDC004782]|uniref:hypothetical protein n=1 Tax=Lentzea sp. NPDC004782 TaxID=3154458 RepID=UPI0033AFE2B8